MDCINKKPLQLVFGDGSIGVSGAAGDRKFRYIFTYATGGLESLSINGKEWLYRTPKPTFWRALTDNDRGNKFHLKSGMWLSADMFINCIGAMVFVDGQEIPLPLAPENNKYTGQESAKQISIVCYYETITRPATKVSVAYTVEENGDILVKAHYFGAEGLPELPVFGLRMIMPACADGFTYKGLSGETYPDRKAGGEAGIYEVKGLPVTPYLVPQDCGMHMDTEWVEIYRSSVLDNRNKEQKQTSIRIEAEGENFAFSCLPYTAQELESALHQEELPVARRTVLCIYGAVRGVGGIDSWGSDVEPAYHVSGEKDAEVSFRITAGQSS